MDNGTTKKESEKSPRYVLLGKHKLMLEVDLDDEFIETARIELRESPELREEGFRQLRLFLQDEPDLCVPTDDQFLEKFLRPTKWYPKSAFNLMKRYFRFAKNHPRLSENLLPSTEEKCILGELLVPLPVRTSNGCRVLVIESGKKWRTKEVDLMSLFRVTIMVLLTATSEPKTQIAGVHVIINMDGFSLNHLTAFNPVVAAIICEWVQKCVFCRLKGIHIVNQPYIFNMLYAIFKPFLLEKTRKRLFFHGNNRETLLAHIDEQAVPTYLGGKLDVPRKGFGKDFFNFMLDREDTFKEFGSYGYRSTTA